jgi:hypothetical protein
VVVLVCGATVGADVLDRLLAVVAGQPITLSDARAAVALGLIEPTKTPDPIAGALDRLIERELVLTEVRRYQPREPSLSQLQARLEAIPRRFADRAAYLRALTSTGMTEPRLEGWVRDDLRAEIYLTERFATPAPPTEDELLRYYRDHEAQFTAGGVLAPFDQVRDQVRAQIVAERRRLLTESWMSGLRRRSEIQILYGILPGR